MIYVPDPIEIMESNIERLMHEQSLLGDNVCPWCKKKADHELIQVSSYPDSPVSCYDCLDEETKKRYDKFEESLTKDGC